MRGRRWCWETVETSKVTTSGSRLDVREVVVVGDGQNAEKNHL